MPRNKVNLHHDAGGHNHAHEHAAHHAHSHDGAAPLSEEQTLALMTYMLDHNRSHADELHNIAHALADQGRGEAAALVSDAVHYFGHCNEKLAEALALLKGE